MILELYQLDIMMPRNISRKKFELFIKHFQNK